jgi:hypothetical protein
MVLSLWAVAISGLLAFGFCGIFSSLYLSAGLPSGCKNSYGGPGAAYFSMTKEDRRRDPKQT